MRSILLLTKKNLTLLLRSKASSLVIVFAPLLLILILGLSYNTASRFSLNIGVYSTSYNDDVNSFIELLKEDEFRILAYETSIEECIEDIKLGVIHACIEVPETLAVQDNTPKEITFYLDPSKINLVYMIQETLKSKFDIKAQQISQEITQNILTKLSNTKTTISGKQSELASARDKSGAAFSSTETLKTTLAGLDLTVSDTSYDTSIISSSANQVDSAISRIASAITSIDDANLTSEDKDMIKSHLQDADGKLDSTLVLLNSSNDSANDSAQTIVAALQADLDSLKNKLAGASGAIASANSNLGSTTASLNEVTASLDSVMASLTVVQESLNALPVTDAKTISSPLLTKIEKVGGGGTYLDYLFPALLVLVVMFTSLLLGTILVMMEKNSPAYLRNFFLPVKKVTFIASTYLTTLILIIVQVLIILGVSLFFLEGSLPLMAVSFLILVISASVFTFLGMALGYLFTSEETGVLASISMGSLLLFVSGVILPLESVSPTLRGLMFFNPFVISEKLIREVFIFSSPFSALWMDLITLIGYAFILFLIIIISESLLHKHLVNRFMRHHHKLRQKDKRAKNDV